MVDGNVDSILTDTGTDGVIVASIKVDVIDDTALAASAAAEIADANWDEARSGHTTQGTFGESFDGIEAGAAIGGTLSTTQMTTDLTEVTNDHYIGRTIVWTSGVLKRQASDITDYDGATKRKASRDWLQQWLLLAGVCQTR